MALAVVIDDDAQVRCLVALMLARAGYEVAQAKNGEEGIELCSALKPEVVVTDIFMPRRDGIDVLREVKTHVRQPRVVAISGGSPRLQVDFLNVAELVAVGRDHIPAVIDFPGAAGRVVAGRHVCVLSRLPNHMGGATTHPSTTVWCASKVPSIDRESRHQHPVIAGASYAIL